jgi:hypothetical protein
MRRTLKLLLLLGIGLALAGKKNGDGVTPGNGDNSIDPTTGKPKTDEQRKKDTTYGDTNAQEDFDGVMRAGDQESQDGRAEDQGSSSEPGTAENGLPTRAELPPFNITPAQFGKKWGKHSKDYGLDPGDPESRQWFQDRASDVHANPDDVRVGPYNPNGGGGPDYVFFRQGNDLVIMKPNGDFVTMFPMDEGNYNNWYLSASPID